MSVTTNFVVFLCNDNTGLLVLVLVLAVGVHFAMQSHAKRDEMFLCVQPSHAKLSGDKIQITSTFYRSNPVSVLTQLMLKKGISATYYTFNFIVPKGKFALQVGKNKHIKT